MKRFYLMTMLLLSLCAISAQAQTQDRPTTDGPVWRIVYLRSKPGTRADYIKFLREHYKPLFDEGKKQGLILDYKFFTKPTSDGPNDWDIANATLFRNYADALDFSEERSNKYNEISLKHYGTAEARTKLSEQFRQLSDFVSIQYMREMILTPIK